MDTTSGLRRGTPVEDSGGPVSVPMGSLLLDMTIFVGGWILAQGLFNGHEAHVSYSKRLAKLALMAAVFLAVRLLLGRAVFYVLLALMTLGIAIIHGDWFRLRHGIHWRTAQPRE